MTPMMTMKPRLRVLLAAGWMLTAAGCAAFTAPSSPVAKTTPAANSSASSGPPPLVQNCGIVSIGSPTKYVCDGKVYTSFKLLEMRQDGTKNHPR